MNVDVRWTGKMSFVGKSGTNHSVVMDTIPDNGGEAAAPSPLEMVLMGLAGCSGMDVLLIVKKKRIAVSAFEITINAERSTEHPKVFTSVNMEYIFEGQDLKQKSLEDSVRLSVEQYCSVAGMVAKTATINWQVTIR